MSRTPGRTRRPAARRLALPLALVCAGGVASGVTGGLAAPVSAAPASGSGSWARITDPANNNTDTVGVARGSDGVLHVVWLRGTGPYALMDTAISRAGAAGPAHALSAGWVGAGYPDAATGPTGIGAFWNGVRTASGHPDGTFEALRPLTGGSWTTTGKPVAGGSTVGDGAPTSATAGRDGAFWTAYAGTDVLEVTRLGRPGHNIAGGECCSQEPGLGTDGVTGDVLVGYYNDGARAGDTGTFVRRFDGSTGVPVGSRARLPQSADAQGQAVDPGERVAVSGRGTGRAGVYVAYGTGYPERNAVRLWQQGAPGSTLLGSAGTNSTILLVTLTPDGAGGLWAVWILSVSGKYSLVARHSDSSVTTWGPPQKVALPKGTSQAYRVSAAGQGSKVDVLVLADLSFRSRLAYYASQVTG